MKSTSFVRLLPLACALLGAASAMAQSTRHPTTGTPPSRQPVAAPLDPSAANVPTHVRNGEVAMTELQSLVSQRELRIHNASKLARQLDASSKAIAGNIGGGGGGAAGPRRPAVCASCPVQRVVR